MEYFCKEIKEKVCVDFENEEIQDIMKAVDILMNRFVGVFNTKYPDIKIERLQLCGSMAEKTRIWERAFLEFDYLAVVKSLPSYGDFIFEHNLDGEIEVKYKTADSEASDSEYVNLNWTLNETFANNFHKCITKQCERNLCNLRRKDNYPENISLLNGCPFCSVYLKFGSLKCINTLQEHGPRFQTFEKVRFMWTSKDKTLRTSYVGVDANAFLRSFDSFDANFNRPPTTFSNRVVLPLHWVDENALEVVIVVDFHPVLNLDVEKIIQNTRRLRCSITRKKVISCPPTVYGEYKVWRTSMYQTQLTTTSQNYKIKFYSLAHFIVKLLNVWEVKVHPELDNNETYFLFPKSKKWQCYKCWRISTCLNELDILDKTSQEHRDAFRVLKFLISALDNCRVFPTIGNYEAKMAMIKHIKECNNPSIGAHICVLNILHDITLLKEGSASMDHPILHLDLYEMLQMGYHKSFETTLSAICLKILILILVQNGLAYTVTDLYNDIISIKLLSETIAKETCYDRLYLQSGLWFVEFSEVKNLYNELHELVTRRIDSASLDELKKVFSFLQRRSRIRNLKNDILQKNLRGIEYL